MSILPPSITTSISLKKTVIVSDRYLPKSFGGAEVSLHNALIASDAQFRSEALVVFFDAEVAEPYLYSLSGISVLAVPDSAAWPFNMISRADHVQQLKNKYYRYGGKYVLPIRSVFQYQDFLLRLGAYYLELGPKPRGGVQSDFLLGDADFRIRSLREIVDATNCELLVADNTRSIMATSAVGGKVGRTVAIVRDHRFNCARHNQIMMVGNKHCSGCDFSCAQADGRKKGFADTLHRKHLERVQESRHRALASYDEVVVTSHILARNIRKLLGENSTVTRVPNPAGSYSEVMSICRGVAEEPMNDILVIGMLNEAKGQLELVNAAVNWLSERKDVRFVFAGRGDRIKKSIQTLVEKKGLKANFVFKDYVGRKDLFKLIRATKVVLLPTLWKEPFGRVPLEAGLARKTVVSFAVGGICETVVDGKTGILVQPGNYAALLDACAELLDDGDLRARLGAGAFDHVVANYLDDQTSLRLINVFRGISGGRDASVSGSLISEKVLA